jgi:flagellar biosynthesis protein FlhB
MANDSSESKNNEATPKRLREAHKRGQVAKSTELSTALSLLCTLLCVVSMASWSARKIADFYLAVDRTFEALSLPAVQAMVLQALILMAQLSLIPLAVASSIYLFSLRMQTGHVFSLDLVAAKLERMDPIKGTLNLVSIRSLVRFSLMLLKACLIALAAFLIFTHILGDAIRVIYADAGAALNVANTALMRLLLWCGGIFVLLGCLDFAYQRWQHLVDMRMSASEVRREHKDDQGDGKLKSERKGFSHAETAAEQLKFVHLSSLVICSSDGQAVVILHRPQQLPAPVYVMRGSGNFGSEILALATRHKVPVINDSVLVKKIYPVCATGVPISTEHLKTVLAYLEP